MRKYERDESTSWKRGDEGVHLILPRFSPNHTFKK